MDPLTLVIASSSLGSRTFFLNSKTGSPCVVRRSFPRDPSSLFEACNVVFMRITRSPCVSRGVYYLQPEILRHQPDLVHTAPHRVAQTSHLLPDGPGSGGNLKSPRARVAPCALGNREPRYLDNPDGGRGLTPSPPGPFANSTGPCRAPSCEV